LSKFDENSKKNSIHFDFASSEFYPHPEKFIPERFNAECGGVKDFKDKGVLLPFGDGPRACLGQKFAMMLLKLAVVEIISKFEISVNKKTPNPLIVGPFEIMNKKKGNILLDFKEL
jgi:cytochrome P450